MAKRAVWSGAVSCSLINFPVKLYTATSEKGVRFNQIDSLSGSRVRQKRVAEATGEPVEYENIVKGFEITPDRYVIVSDEELADAAPTKTKAITIDKFVSPSEVEPLALDTGYYVGAGDGGEHAYVLLGKAMRKTGRVGVGTFVLRSKERPFYLRAMPNGVLVLQTMRFADEIDSPNEFVPSGEAKDRELAMTEQLIEAMTEPLNFEEYHDEFRARVLAMIELKGQGLELAPVEPTEEVSTADMMSALEASLAAVRGDEQAVPAT